jgi:hypothetical protein
LLLDRVLANNPVIVDLLSFQFRLPDNKDQPCGKSIEVSRFCKILMWQVVLNSSCCYIDDKSFSCGRVHVQREGCKRLTRELFSNAYHIRLHPPALRRTRSACFLSNTLSPTTKNVCSASCRIVASERGQARSTHRVVWRQYLFCCVSKPGVSPCKTPSRLGKNRSGQTLTSYRASEGCNINQAKRSARVAIDHFTHR